MIRLASVKAVVRITFSSYKRRYAGNNHTKLASTGTSIHWVVVGCHLRIAFAPELGRVDTIEGILLLDRFLLECLKAFVLELVVPTCGLVGIGLAEIIGAVIRSTCKAILGVKRDNHQTIP